MALTIFERVSVGEAGSVLVDWLSVLGFFALKASFAMGMVQAVF